MPQRRGFDRRSGLALLGLGAATNFLPWMELANGLTATTETVGPREWGVGLGMCIFAAVLISGVWLLGRRRPPAAGTRMPQPRRTGLQATLAACAANALLAAVILFLGTREVGGPLAEFGTFAFLWFVVPLPLLLVAAFALGRSSAFSPGRRRAASDAGAAS